MNDRQKIELLNRAEDEKALFTYREFMALCKLLGFVKNKRGKWVAGSMDDCSEELERLKKVEQVLLSKRYPCCRCGRRYFRAKRKILTNGLNTCKPCIEKDIRGLKLLGLPMSFDGITEFEAKHGEGSLDRLLKEIEMGPTVEWN